MADKGSGGPCGSSGQTHLSVAHSDFDHDNRLRSFSDDDRRSPRRASHRRVVAGVYTSLLQYITIITIIRIIDDDIDSNNCQCHQAN